MIQIDHDRLADGLEDGIGETRTFGSIVKHERLRAVACGLVNTAVHLYAEEQSLSSRLLISRGRFDVDPEDAHVLAVVGDTVIDAAYSFIFKYVGMSWQYQYASGGEDIFPPEKVLSFSFDETESTVRGLARTAHAFHARNRHPIGFLGEDVGSGPLAGESLTAIGQAYSQIYDLSRYDAWRPPERVLRDADVVARRIVSNCIASASGI